VADSVARHEAARGRRTGIIRRLIEEGFNLGKSSVADEVCSPDFVNRVCVYGVPRGPAGLSEHISLIRRAYPDLELIVTDVVFEGDTVCIQWVSKGTAAGTYMGLDATGRTFWSAQIAFYTFTGDRVTDWRGTFDSMALFRAVTGQGDGDPVPEDIRDRDPWVPPSAGSSQRGPEVRAAAEELLTDWLGSTRDADLPGSLGDWSRLRLVGQSVTTGRSAFLQRREHLRSSFGSCRVKLESVTVEADRAAIRWVLEGDHIGTHLGIRATGRDVRLVSSALLRFDGPRLLEWCEIFDDTGFVDQTKTLYVLTPATSE
jgi:predicted ester cyclase